MRDFKEKVRVKRTRKRRIEKMIIGAALIGTALIAAGFYNGDQQRVEETYTVKHGDTIWSIGEEYIHKNTGGRRYLPEFVEGIKEMNPWVKENDYIIHAGDKIQISYWIKKPADAE
jgi:hypothetical protein